jgi:hypothetical protein
MSSIRREQWRSSHPGDVRRGSCGARLRRAQPSGSSDTTAAGATSPAGRFDSKSEQAQPTKIGDAQHRGKLLLGSSGEWFPTVWRGFRFFLIRRSATTMTPKRRCGLRAYDSIKVQARASGGRPPVESSLPSPSITVNF